MKRFVICAILVFACVSVALAQLPTATILGTVKDASGAIVAGATITARGVDTGQLRTAISEADGSYRFNALPVGNYEVRAEQAGFKASVRGGITLAVDQQAVVDFALEVGATTEQIEVTGEAPVVNTTSGTLGGLVDEQRMADLPLNGREYVQLALLQSGVTEDRSRTSSNTALASSGTWFSSNGAPPRSNAYLLDGTSLAAYGGASGASIAGNTLGLDGVREFRIVTNSFDAEYGMVMGSQMAMVSKSGTNSFHGGAFDYLRNSALDARNFFDTAAGSGKTASGAQRRLPLFRRNNFGGSVGGPIIKDKTFFFATYEEVSQVQGTTAVVNTIPAGCEGVAGATINFGTASGQCPLAEDTGAPTSVVINPAITQFFQFYPAANAPGVKNNFGWSNPTPTSEEYAQMRIDHTFNAKDNLLGRFTIDNASINQPSATFPGWNFPTTSRGQYLTLSENHIFSPALLNTARASYSRATSYLGQAPWPTGPGLSVEGGPGNYVPMGGITPGSSLTAVGTATGVSQATQNVFSISDDAFYTRGKNSFKFGFLGNRYQVFVANGVSTNGSISFSNYNDFLEGNLKSVTAIQQPGVNFRTIHYNTIGMYVADDYRATDRLTLNLGFRYEFNTDAHAVGVGSNFNAALINPQSDQNFTSTNLLSRNPSYHNWSPRVGFAWDVFGDGKTSIRGGFGVLYNIAGWVSFLHGALRSPPGQNQITVNEPTCPVVGTGTCYPETPTNLSGWTLPLSFTGNLAPVGPARNPANFDWNMKQAHMIQYNFAIQRQLPWQMALTLAYGGSRGFDLQSLSDGNPVIPNGVPGIATVTAGTAPNTVMLTGPSCLAQPLSIPYQQMNLIDGQANVCVTPGTNNAPRLNPNFGGYNTIADNRSSFFNSAQVQLEKRITQGLQFQTNFTWSKLIDDAQGSSSAAADIVGGAVYDSDPWNPNLDRGRGSFDLPTSWKTNLLYHFPKANLSGPLDKLVNGWWVSSIFQIQGGFPVEPEITNNRSYLNVDGNKMVDRPDLVPGRNAGNITSGVSPGCLGVPAGTPLGTPTEWFDPCAFTLQPVGFLGNSPRDFINGPKYRVVDFSAVKDTKVGWLGEAGGLEFRAEIFNILNHANFQEPGNLVFTGATGVTTKAPFVDNDFAHAEAPNSASGVITATTGSSRQIQLSLRIMF